MLVKYIILIMVTLYDMTLITFNHIFCLSTETIPLCLSLSLSSSLSLSISLSLYLSLSLSSLSLYLYLFFSVSSSLSLSLFFMIYLFYLLFSERTHSVGLDNAFTHLRSISSPSFSYICWNNQQNHKAKNKYEIEAKTCHRILAISAMPFSLVKFNMCNKAK